MSPTQTPFHAHAAPEAGTGSMTGTVGAAVEPAEYPFYGRGIGPLTSGTPFGSADLRRTVQTVRAPASRRASDLIDELREISGQVNRMMEQVERAIDRLAVHAG